MKSKNIPNIAPIKTPAATYLFTRIKHDKPIKNMHKTNIK